MNLGDPGSQAPARRRNRDAPTRYGLVSSGLLVAAVAGLVTPQRWQVLALVFVVAELLGRYLLPWSAEVVEEGGVFRWPLRRVRLSSATLARARVLRSGVTVIGLRPRGGVRFGLRPSWFPDRGPLIAALEDVIRRVSAAAVGDPLGVIDALRRL